VFIPAYLGKKEMHGGCIGMIIPVDVHADSLLNHGQNTENDDRGESRLPSTRKLVHAETL